MWLFEGFKREEIEVRKASEVGCGCSEGPSGPSLAILVMMLMLVVMLVMFVAMLVMFMMSLGLLVMPRQPVAPLTYIVL